MLCEYSSPHLFTFIKFQHQQGRKKSAAPLISHTKTKKTTKVCLFKLALFERLFRGSSEGCIFQIYWNIALSHFPSRKLTLNSIFQIIFMPMPRKCRWSGYLTYLDFSVPVPILKQNSLHFCSSKERAVFCPLQAIIV